MKSMDKSNSFGASSRLDVGGKQYHYYSLESLEKRGLAKIGRIPYSIKILLENLLRCEDGRTVKPSDIEYVAKWQIGTQSKEINFRPARVLLQDFTGVPCVVDLAAMRDALRAAGSDPKLANPLIPADLVIDHSVQVDEFGTSKAFGVNALLEFQRNQERYAFLRWGQKAFRNFRVVPPDTGIVHQVNLEYLAPVVFTDDRQSPALAYPDTLVGTDSHTTMINGLGVVGWGVGGIEAEACMLGQPISMLLTRSGRIPTHRQASGGFHRDGPGADCYADAAEEGRGRQIRRVLRPRSRLRCRWRIEPLSATWRPNMARPSASSQSIDQTLDYLRLTNRSKELIELVEAYAKAQGLFLTKDSPEPEYSDTLALDLASVVPSMAGPKRPQDRIDLPDVKKNFLETLKAPPKSAVIGSNGLEDYHTGRRGGHRRHHQLHQHVESFGDGGGGAARQESRREGPENQALGEVEPRARLQSGHRLSGRRRPHALPRKAPLQPGRLWLHHLHRKQRPPARARRRSRAKRKAGGRGRAERQSEFRGPYQFAGARELSRIAAAGGGLCVGRPRGHRSPEGPDRDRQRGQTRLS